MPTLISASSRCSPWRPSPRRSGRPGLARRGRRAPDPRDRWRRRSGSRSEHRSRCAARASCVDVLGLDQRHVPVEHQHGSDVIRERLERGTHGVTRPARLVLQAKSACPSNASRTADVRGEVTISGVAPVAARAASTTYASIGRPQIGWRSLGVRDRIRVPSPAANTIGTVRVGPSKFTAGAGRLGAAAREGVKPRDGRRSPRSPRVRRAAGPPPRTSNAPAACPPKNGEYTSLKASKSAMSIRKQVVLTTSPSPVPRPPARRPGSDRRCGLGLDALASRPVAGIEAQLAGAEDAAVGVDRLAVGAEGGGCPVGGDALLGHARLLLCRCAGSASSGTPRSRAAPSRRSAGPGAAARPRRAPPRRRIESEEGRARSPLSRNGRSSTRSRLAQHRQLRMPGPQRDEGGHRSLASRSRRRRSARCGMPSRRGARRRAARGLGEVLPCGAAARGQPRRRPRKTVASRRPTAGTTEQEPPRGRQRRRALPRSPMAADERRRRVAEEERDVRAQLGGEGPRAAPRGTTTQRRRRDRTRPRRRCCRRPDPRPSGCAWSATRAAASGRSQVARRNAAAARSTRLSVDGAGRVVTVGRQAGRRAPARSGRRARRPGRCAGRPIEARGSRRAASPGDGERQVDLGRRGGSESHPHGERSARPSAPQAPATPRPTASAAVGRRRCPTGRSAASSGRPADVRQLARQHVVEHLAPLPEAGLDQPPQLAPRVAVEAARPGLADQDCRLDLRRGLERRRAARCARRARRRGTGRRPRGSSCRRAARRSAPRPRAGASGRSAPAAAPRPGRGAAPGW